MNEEQNTLIGYILEHLPHGSGIDGDWSMDFNEKKQEVSFYNSYHYMDGYGYYRRWIDFKVRISLKHIDNFYLSFRGPSSDYWYINGYGIREYLNDTIRFSLEEAGLI